VQTTWDKSYGSTIPLELALAPDATPVKVMRELDFERVFGLYRKLLTMR
jgi:hypothetical protein